MTKTEFIAFCIEHFIDPAVALENKELRDALKTKQDQIVINILQNDF